MTTKYAVLFRRGERTPNLDELYTRQDDDRYAFYTPPGHLDIFIPHNGNNNYVDRLV